MSGFTKTTEGLVKAAMGLASRAGKDAKHRASRPKYEYVGDGVAVHGKKYLSEAKRAEINLILKDYNEAQTPDDKRVIMAQLATYPVRMVPVIRRITLDRSRYTGERMREIGKSGGGVRERARRLRQRAQQRPLDEMALQAAA